MWLEESFIFFPVRYPEGDYDLAQHPPDDGQVYPVIEDQWLTTDDGVKLHGWYCRPGGMPQSDKRPVLLYFHGNAGNVSHRYSFLALLTLLDMDVLIVDYRGYGRSEGKPGGQGILTDGEAAWRWLTIQRQVDPKRIVVLGKSLGGAVAVALAGRPDVRPSGVILQSTFTSIADMAASMLPMIPRVMIR
ncbi:MAG: alpha/beta fold hydrolase, partial [Phycisphaeraceae bacterium]|nr:alpha/beta fold hydrolase [Phycisphaeraceae bacterium]